MMSNIAIGGYIEKILFIIEKAKKENQESEKILELVVSKMEKDKADCDIGWY